MSDRSHPTHSDLVAALERCKEDRAFKHRQVERLAGRADALEAERDRYREAMREAMDIMASANDRELGEGGVARKAYAHLYYEYFATPAGIAKRAKEALGG